MDLAALDSDTSILLYNLAALHFQRKEYTAAQSILENLFAHIEPIDETVAVHVCFLLLDVLLHMARGTLLTERERAAFSHKTEQILSHMEKVRKGPEREGKERLGGRGESEGDWAVAAPARDEASARTLGNSPLTTPHSRLPSLFFLRLCAPPGADHWGKLVD